MQINVSAVCLCSKASHFCALDVDPREPELMREGSSGDDWTQENLRGRNPGGHFYQSKIEMVQMRDRMRQ